MCELTHLAAARFGPRLFRKSRTGAGVESAVARFRVEKDHSRGCPATSFTVLSPMWAACRKSRCSCDPRAKGWVHKTANVSASAMKSAQPSRKAALAGDPQRRGPRPRPGGVHHVRPGLRRVAPPGWQGRHRWPGPVGGVLGLSGRALGPLAHHGPHGVVGLPYRRAAGGGGGRGRPRLLHCRAGHGIQGCSGSWGAPRRGSDAAWGRWAGRRPIPTLPRSLRVN